MKNTKQPKRLVGCELIQVAAENPARFVQSCEQRYQKGLEMAAEEILRSGRHIVMLTGASSAGKTTSSKRLAAAIRAAGKNAEVLSLDDFFVGAGKYPKQANGADDYECLEALDVADIHRCLKDLHETGHCTAPVFSFITQQPCGTQEINQGDGVTIVEGLHALNPALVADLPENSVMNLYASLREQYADENGDRRLLTRNVRLARRIVRDWRFRGHEPSFTLKLWKHVCNGEDTYIKVFRDRADIMLDTSFSYEVCLWGRHLAQLLPAEDYRNAFSKLLQKFSYFPEIPDELVPEDSMMREFIGKATEN